jgi:hypothetical protein
MIVLRDPDEPRPDLDVEVRAAPGTVESAVFFPQRSFRMLGLKVAGPEENALRWCVRQIWVGLEKQIVGGADVPLSVLLSRPGSPALLLPAIRVGQSIRIELVNTDTRWRTLMLKLLGEELRE